MGVEEGEVVVVEIQGQLVKDAEKAVEVEEEAADVRFRR